VRRALLVACLILCTREAEAQGRPIPFIMPAGPKVDSTKPEIFRTPQPVVYETWWKEIARCQGLILPVELASRVQIIVVNSREMIVDGEWGIMGFASVYRLQIYVVIGEVWKYDTVAHEMLHFLLTWNGIDQGKNWHPELYYSRCGMSRWYEG
jgi:hypothetical protein